MGVLQKQEMISIIIPVYRVEKYIEKCVNSICDQTYKAFEVILVDDAGQDNSIGIAKKILEKNQMNFKVVSKLDSNGDIVNQGLANARNLGIINASGEWVICIDSDDYIHPQMLEQLHSAISSDKRVDFCFCDYLLVTPESDPKLQAIKKAAITKYTSEELIHAFYDRTEPIVVPTIILRKSFIDQKQLFYPKDCRFSEDSYYVYNLLLHSSFAAKVNVAMYYYVQHAHSIMTSSNIEKIMTGFNSFVILDEMLKKKCDQHSFNLQKIFPREILGELHTASKVLVLRDFLTLRSLMGLPQNKLLAIKNDALKTKLARFLLVYFPRIFYLCARIK